MSSKKEPVLRPEEVEEQAILREPAHPYDMEAAVLDSDGTLNVWNERGQTVEIRRHNRDAVIGLLMQGRLNAQHMNALLEASGDGPVPVPVKDSLRDLFEKLNHLTPHVVPELTVPGHRTVALLWTVNAELHITSCMGEGKDFLRATDRELLQSSPDLWSLVGSTDPEHPLVTAHLRALAGESCKFEYDRQHRWCVYLRPVMDEGQVIGVVGYATVTGAAPAKQGADPVRTAYMITSPDGQILTTEGDLFSVYGIGTSDRLQGKEYVTVVQEHVLPIVEKPKPYVKRLAEVMSSLREEVDRIALTNGKLIYRTMQPLRGPTGAIIARAWLLAEIAEQRSVRAAVALLIFAFSLFTPASGPLSVDDDGPDDVPAMVQAM